MRRRWSGLLGGATALGIVLALVPVVRGNIDMAEPLRKLQGKAAPPAPPNFSSLDLLRLDVRPSKVLAPLDEGRKAELTLDPVVQRAVRAEMESYRIPQSGVVMMEVKTGRIIAYASYVGMTWLRYGRPAPAGADDVDPLLDQFMPVCEVAERHHIHVVAPAEVTFAAACEEDLMSLPVARAIFKAREVLLGSQPAKGTALDIPPEPSAGCQCILARLARLGPPCGSQRVPNSRNEPHSGPTHRKARKPYRARITG